MGWKTFKQHFEIGHIVTIDREQRVLQIGSPYIHNLVEIDISTGAVVKNGIGARDDYFLRDYYPNIAAATDAERKALIDAADAFDRSIAVFTYDRGDIIEKQCEETGWPNVTHDGQLMYENTFSTDKAWIVARAKRNAALRAERQADHVKRCHEDLAKAQAWLFEAHDAVSKLNTDYPDIPGDEAADADAEGDGEEQGDEGSAAQGAKG